MVYELILSKSVGVGFGFGAEAGVILLCPVGSGLTMSGRSQSLLQKIKMRQPRSVWLVYEEREWLSVINLAGDDP